MAYFQDTKKRSYSYLFAIVLLVLYEGSVLLMRSAGRGQVIIAVDSWFNSVLALVPNGTLFASIGVALFAATIVYLDRKEGVELRGKTFVYMFIESAVWALGLFLFMPQFIYKLLNPDVTSLQANSGGTTDLTLLEEIGLSFGAGFYEELFFRLVLVSILLLLVKLFKGDPKHPLPQVGVAVVAALLFSAVHYIGSLGDTFTVYSFIYRFIMGLLFSGMLLLRGFGITAWAHALYDVLVFTAQAFDV